MKVKIFIISFSAVCLFTSVKAQTIDQVLEGDTTRDRVVKVLYDIRKQERDSAAKFHTLVSDYTFRNIIKADFSTLTGLDNTATVGRYGSLNIDKDASTFTFTPITIAKQDLTSG